MKKKILGILCLATIIFAQNVAAQDNTPASITSDASSSSVASSPSKNVTQEQSDSVAPTSNASESANTTSDTPNSISGASDAKSEVKEQSDVAAIPRQSLQKSLQSTAQIPTQAMYRLYNPNSGEHFYTAFAEEAKKVIQAKWNYEGIGWYAPMSGDPVYRLYNPNAGDHHYTLSEYEKNYLVSLGWRYEGIGWYSDQNKSLQLYRAYNPNARSGSHNYTLNGNEQNNLVRAGWRNEGIAWYASGVIPKSSEDGVLQQLYNQIKNVKPQIGSPVYFSQWDARWSGNRFNSSTIGPSGCVPTSLAMILRGSYGMNLTPADVAARMNIYSKWAVGASGQDIIATANSYGRPVEVITSQVTAQQRLQEGYPLIWLVNVGIGHAVVSYGNSNGKTEVFDPYNRQFFNGWYDISYLWGKPSADPMDWDAGRPVFVIK